MPPCSPIASGVFVCVVRTRGKIGGERDRRKSCALLLYETSGKAHLCATTETKKN